jgi:hypothetical protein
MKAHTLLTGLCLLLSVSLFASNEVRGEKGTVMIVSAGPDRVVVALDSAKDATDGLVDQWFILQMDMPSELPLPVYLRAADVRFRPGYVRVIAPTEQKVYDFALTGVKIERDVPAGFSVVRTEGFGLSHNLGETDIAIAAPCANCESLTQDWTDAGDTGGGSSTCTAGGIGATSSSIRSGTRSAQVACNSFSYACCKSTATSVSCKCVH